MSEYLIVVNFYQKHVDCYCRRKKKQNKTSYLFMMTPLYDDNEIEDQDESQRQISQLKRSIDNRFKYLESLINRQLIKDMSNSTTENKARFNSLEQVSKMRHSSLSASIREIGRKQKEIDDLAREEREVGNTEVKAEVKQ